MRWLSLLAAAPLVLACSASRESESTPGGFRDASVPDVTLDGDPGQEFALPADTSPPCVGLKCQQRACPGSGSTRVTGSVYDPAGRVPLYNVIVYVPNAELEPMPKGVSCDKCGTITSGSPIVTTLTDSSGKFELKDVPVGKNIPLVMQVGKWRRKVVIPEVKECVDNPIADKNLTRLPKNRKEGDLPQMALVTGGCDELECLFRKIGIDDSEYSGGGGSGAMHLYRGQGGSTLSGITDAQPFWSNQTTLKNYDMVILSCECSEYMSNKGTDSLNAMFAYANSGGRIFASHYHYTWFKNGPPDWQKTATWGGTGSTTGLYQVDTSFPKGKAFGEWLVATGASSTLGQISLTSVKSDVGVINPMTSTRWVYSPSPESVKYYSFNTPVNKPVEQQCGRSVFSDIHVSNESGGGSFPSSCSSGLDLTPQEKALEFLFFDLSSCIQKDGDPPRPPPPK